MSSIDILFEDNHLLVVNKPPGLATMGAESGETTLHALGAEYLRTRYNKPGRAFLGIVSRLDAMTSGVIVMAKTSKAASRLTPQFAQKGNDHAKKLYLAVLEGQFNHEPGELVNFVRKDDKAKRMRVCGERAEGAQLARLRFAKIAQSDQATLIAVELLTGRKHQIRVQFAERGFPIWADRKYGGQHSLRDGIGLHSLQLGITHPTLRTAMVWRAPVPRSWRTFGKLIPSKNQIEQQIADLFST
ncbi:Ribosomal large subunit pseudouridine synthase C [Planctomycetes bacterium CA13]|uniref:Ribosomal large subunit pseudouridine synthase C n=1 Tax=Novipirellula herctigrandis TaxID=2527986 RepID=A0A5C5YNS4_9BACT|nr:Ribosomal large subunit pseudouridine synthase C [Planctomycetes bacterium CA13]